MQYLALDDIWTLCFIHYSLLCFESFLLIFTPYFSLPNNPISLLDEIAPQLVQKIINAVPDGVSGVLNVKTESWSSKDNVTHTSEKTESWGGSRHIACFYCPVALYLLKL